MSGRARDLARRALSRVAWELGKRSVRARLARRDARVSPPGGEGTILFFTPEGSIPQHLAAACLVARALRERGHPVVMASCLDVFARCPVMDNYQLPTRPSKELREQTCYRCAEDGMKAYAYYGLEALSLRELLTDEIKASVARALRDEPRNLLDLTFDDVPFGRLCAMNLALRHKVSDFSAVGEDERAVWLDYIRAAVTSYLLADGIFRRRKVSAVVQYNDYSLCLGVRMAARRHGVRAVTMTHPAHKNIDRQSLLLSPEVASYWIYRLFDEWPRWKDLSLPAARIASTVEDLYFRFRSSGSHNYSPAKTSGNELRARLGLAGDRKLLVAYTSSLDELTSMYHTYGALGHAWPTGPTAFKDEIECLGALTAFVERSSEYRLVIRVHPREGANKRDRRESQNLGRLRAAFGGTYRHCRVVWPSDPVSSYDLGELADLALISFSSMGLELARLGVPVLALSPFLAPCPWGDFIRYAETPERYFAAIREATSSPTTSLDTILGACRWYHLFTLASTVDLGDVVPSPDYPGLPPFRVPKAAETIESAILGRKEVTADTEERLRAAQGPGLAAEEKETLRRELRRFVHYLIEGRDDPTAREDEATYRLGGSCVEYERRGKIVTVDSPLIARLAPFVTSRIHAQETRKGRKAS